MKAILRFDLPEDEQDLYYAQHGVDYCLVLEDLNIWLRTKYKYEQQETIKIEEVRTKLHELKSERNLE